MAACDALKQEIDAKLQAKGIQSYTLEIQPVQAASAAAAAPKSGGKVVGTCDGGTKNIIYLRGASAAPAKAAAPAAAAAAAQPASAAPAAAPAAPAAPK